MICTRRAPCGRPPCTSLRRQPAQRRRRRARTVTQHASTPLPCCCSATSTSPSSRAGRPLQRPRRECCRQWGVGVAWQAAVHAVPVPAPTPGNTPAHARVLLSCVCACCAVQLLHPRRRNKGPLSPRATMIASACSRQRSDQGPLRLPTPNPTRGRLRSPPTHATPPARSHTPPPAPTRPSRHRPRFAAARAGPSSRSAGCARRWSMPYGRRGPTA